MPGMNGLELFERVARLPVPVACLLLTGSSSFFGRSGSADQYVLTDQARRPKPRVGVADPARRNHRVETFAALGRSKHPRKLTERDTLLCAPGRLVGLDVPYAFELKTSNRVETHVR